MRISVNKNTERFSLEISTEEALTLIRDLATNVPDSKGSSSFSLPLIGSIHGGREFATVLDVIVVLK